MRNVRIVAGVVLAGLLIFFTWFAFREDGRLKTVPGVPHAVWYYLDHHSTIRNGAGFLVLGFLGALAFGDSRSCVQVASMVFCAAAPMLKDMAQLFTQTRHFNWDATGLGVLGALVGWWAGFWLTEKLVCANSAATVDKNDQ